MQYGPSIFVKQLKSNNGFVLTDSAAPYAWPYTYTVSPSIESIKRLVARHPGNLWLVGNEIERRDWSCDDNCSLGQGEILPEVYAVTFHEIYTAIKAADPTAKVSNGSVILPSPLRLQYMTRMWDEYVRLYQTPMPVDVWQIHLYLMQEKAGDFGADIPPGIDDDGTGLYANLSPIDKWLVNKKFSEVKPLLIAFREWMKAHGQQNKPLIITEMAVMVPDWIPELTGEFTPEKIRDDFLYQALEMVFQAKDTNLGYPLDDYRLVQSIWWWSLDKDYGKYVTNEFGQKVFLQSFNGNLAWPGIGGLYNAPNPMGISKLGEYWASYVSHITDDTNLRPVGVHPGAGYSANGEPVTVTVNLKIANSGNVAVTTPFTVRFLRNGTSIVLASATVNGRLEGCGDVYQSFYAPIPNLAPGVHTIRAIVDYGDQVPELNENDNEFVFKILIVGHHLNLPMIIRRSGY